MSYCTAKVIASSYSNASDKRIDTLQLRYPRIIHAELLTHRAMSRNASSSRAIPTASLLARDEIFIPTFAKNKPGMQAGEFLSPEDQEEAAIIWEDLAEHCKAAVDQLRKLNVHKQWASRPLEWFGFIDVVVTSTNWSNFFALRDHSDAQPEIRDLAVAMKEALANHNPVTLRDDEWHLPYVQGQRATLGEAKAVLDTDAAPALLDAIRPTFAQPALNDLSDYMRLLLAISSARCCRVSYAKHDGTPSSVPEDIDRFNKLIKADLIHASPFEHQARSLRVTDDPFLQGNFDGFLQFRKTIPNECL